MALLPIVVLWDICLAFWNRTLPALDRKMTRLTDWISTPFNLFADGLLLLWRWIGPWARQGVVAVWRLITWPIRLFMRAVRPACVRIYVKLRSVAVATSQALTDVMKLLLRPLRPVVRSIHRGWSGVRGAWFAAMAITRRVSRRLGRQLSRAIAPARRRLVNLVVMARGLVSQHHNPQP